jgi:hypothetical protein
LDARNVATSHGTPPPFGGETGPASCEEPPEEEEEEPKPELPPLDDVLLEDPELDEDSPLPPDELVDDPELLDVAASAVGVPVCVHMPRFDEGAGPVPHEATRARGANAAIQTQERSM